MRVLATVATTAPCAVCSPRPPVCCQALDPAQLDAVVLSMERVAVASGEAIITQGDEGNHFYVVDR